MALATFGELQIAYEVQGEGRPIVLIAGLASDRTSWRGLERRLASSFRVVTFDHRGIGRSSAPRGVYPISTLAADVVQLLDHIGIDRAHVLGVSMGGMIALELAIRNGERVDGLILGCTHPGGTLQVRPEQRILDKLTGLGKSQEQMASDFLAITHSARFAQTHPRVVEQMLADRQKMGMTRRTYSLQLGAIRSHDVSARLDAIRSPTLVLAGAEDELVPPANSEILAARIAGAKLVVLPEVGHAFWVEAPDRAEREVVRFLSGGAAGKSQSGDRKAGARPT